MAEGGAVAAEDAVMPSSGSEEEAIVARELSAVEEGGDELVDRRGVLVADHPRKGSDIVCNSDGAEALNCSFVGSLQDA